MWAFLLLTTEDAAAERLVTYGEALGAAAANNGTYVTSAHQVDAAEGRLRSARGQFDPLYRIDASSSRSRSQGFLQGFPFDSARRSWTAATGVSGAAVSGTSYDLALGLSHNVQEFTTFYPRGGTGPFSGGPQTTIQDAYRATFDASVTQQILRGVRFRWNAQNVERAAWQLDAAELAAEQARQQALFDTATAYWTWVYRTEVRKNADDNVGVAEEALRVGRLQVGSGTLAPVEVARLEAALVQARAAAIDAANQAEAAANQVLLLMGESPDQDAAPATPAGDADPIALDAAKAAEVAREGHLGLRVARTNLELARFNVTTARHGTLPVLAATAGAGVGSQRCPPGSDTEGCVDGGALAAFGGLAADDNQPYWTVGGSFSVPLRNRTAQGTVDANAAEVARQERALADLERSVVSQVEVQVRVLASAATRVELADANVAFATQTLAAEEARLAAGRGLQKDVLEARNALLVAKAEGAKARTDWRLAQASLLMLQGRLDAAEP